jgi:hypothetical protein
MVFFKYALNTGENKEKTKCLYLFPLSIFVKHTYPVLNVDIRVNECQQY